jgi:phosphinothricin acetyltransferase
MSIVRLDHRCHRLHNLHVMSVFITRSATRADAEAINAILNPYIEKSTATFITEPMTLAQRLAWFDEHLDNHPVIVAECDGIVVGFGALSTFRARAAYAQTAEIAVYIREDFHRRGIGRMIIGELTTRARALGHHTLVGVCCSESEASIGLLESCGFVRAGHLHQVGRKFGRWLDIVILEFLIAGSTQRP